MSQEGQDARATEMEGNEARTEAPTEGGAGDTIESQTKSTTSKKRKPLPPRSEVWDHFTPFVDDGGVDKARCNHCAKVYMGNTKRNGTSSLKNHLNSCKKLPLSGQMKQTQLSLQSIGENENILTKWQFDQKASRLKLAAMIIIDELPFKFVENEGFREFMQTTQPNFKIQSALGDRFIRHKMESGEVESRCELDIYLKESVFVTKNEEFDILNWWKLNSSRFPILSQLARDVLAIHVSTVASESAFSTGGRVLDAFRSSLTPKVVESLLCAQNWLWKSKHHNSVEEDMISIEKIESAFSAISVEETDETVIQVVD